MSRKINEQGNQYGRLLVQKYSGKDKHRKILWKCKCDCGNITIVVGSNLRKGQSKSCGCLHKEIISKLFKGRKDVGGENNPMYGVHRLGKDAPRYGKHHTEETRKKISKASKGRIGWNKNKKYPQIAGANHPNWKGGITSKRAKDINSLEHKQWR